MKVNGQTLQLEKSTTLLQYLQENKYDIVKIAVILNENIVPKATYSEIMLQEEDVIEVVSFMGGG